MFSRSKPIFEAEPDPMHNRPSPGRDAAGGAETSFSIIGADVMIKGDIEASVDLHIDGNIEGNVHCAALVQGSGSVITGGVIAESARLGGRIVGSIEAVDLVIEAGAEIEGDVTYSNLTIEPGGKVEGGFRHKSSLGKRPAATNSKPSTPEPANIELIDSGQDIGMLRA